MEATIYTAKIGNNVIDVTAQVTAITATALYFLLQASEEQVNEFVSQMPQEEAKIIELFLSTSKENLNKTNKLNERKQGGES